MIQRGSKISLLMLIIVFCAFSFVGCGNGDKVTTDVTTNPTEESVSQDTEAVNEAAGNYDQVKITVTSPAENEVAEGGTLHIVGKAEGTAQPGKDKVYMELLTGDDLKLGESSSLVADLDYEFSSDLKYEITSNMAKNDDGTVDAKLRVYMKDDNGSLTKEQTVHVKVK